MDILFDRLAVISGRSKSHTFKPNTIVKIEKLASNFFKGISLDDGTTQLLKGDEFEIITRKSSNKNIMSLSILTDEELDYYGNEYSSKKKAKEIKDGFTFIQYLTQERNK